MTNIYELTKKIHETIDLINAKYGLEIEIKSDNDTVIYETGMINADGSAEINKAKIDYCECYISGTGELMRLSSNNFVAFTLAEDWQFEIGEYQIKQILNALKDLLGENPEYEELENAIKNLYKDGGYDRYVMCVTHIVNKYIPQSQAEALCQKWLDGLNPIFDSNPEMVLTELLEVLENLI